MEQELRSQGTAVHRGTLIPYVLFKAPACCPDAIHSEDETSICKDLHFSSAVQSRKQSVYGDSEFAVFVVAG